MMFSIVSACSSLSRGIGFNNQLSWPKCQADMNFFRNLTIKTKDPLKMNAVIMGKNTYYSLQMPKGLPKRVNVILSKKTKENENPNLHEYLTICKSLDDALEMLSRRQDIESIFVIGGQQVYETAIRHAKCERIYLNMIRVRDAVFDTFFPEIDESIYVKESETQIDEDVTSLVYKRKERK